MDSERRTLIVTAAVGLLVLAIIIGSIYYLVKFIQNRQVTTQHQSVQTSQTASAQPISSTNPQASANPSVPANVDLHSNAVYNGSDFQLIYPKGWSILTCSNSSNIELDPAGGQDQLKANCDVAQKPITIITNSTGCANGSPATLGSNKVIKTKATQGDYIRYEWCTQSQPPLYITHRVSTSGAQATSKQDYSSQVEDMISKINFSHGS